MTKEKSFEQYLKGCHDSFCTVILLKNEFVYYAKDEDNLRGSVFKNFKQISLIQWRVLKLLIIELYKLLKGSEGHSLLRLVKRFKNNFVTQEDEIETAEQLIGRLNQINDDPMLKVVFNLRNKHYAHLSTDRNKYEVSMSAKDLSEFIDKLTLLFKDIYSYVKPGTTISFTGLNSDTEIRMHMYKALERYMKFFSIYEKILLSDGKYQVSNSDIVKIINE